MNKVIKKTWKKQTEPKLLTECMLKQKSTGCRRCSLITLKNNEVYKNPYSKLQR